MCDSKGNLIAREKTNIENDHKNDTILFGLHEKYTKDNKMKWMIYHRNGTTENVAQIKDRESTTVLSNVSKRFS